MYSIATSPKLHMVTRSVDITPITPIMNKLNSIPIPYNITDTITNTINNIQLLKKFPFLNPSKTSSTATGSERAVLTVIWKIPYNKGGVVIIKVLPITYTISAITYAIKESFILFHDSLNI